MLSTNSGVSYAQYVRNKEGLKNGRKRNIRELLRHLFRPEDFSLLYFREVEFHRVPYQFSSATLSSQFSTKHGPLTNPAQKTIYIYIYTYIYDCIGFEWLSRWRLQFTQSIETNDVVRNSHLAQFAMASGPAARVALSLNAAVFCSWGHEHLPPKGYTDSVHVGWATTSVLKDSSCQSKSHVLHVGWLQNLRPNKC